MSYVGEPFTQDLFISYSHGADAAGHPFLQAWSVAFTKALESELRFEPRFRDVLQLFIDHDFRPGQGVDPMTSLTCQLREQIGRSAILVVLMSPDYIASHWCKQEREWWHQSQGTLGISSEARIAIIHAMRTTEAWPDLFKDSAGQPLVGFPFYASIEGAVRPLGWTDPTDAFGTEFKKALLGVVARLCNALDKTKLSLDERRLVQADANKLAQDGGQAIYLHGRADQAPLWQRTAASLGEKGFAVLPGEPELIEQDPKQRQKTREQRVELMSSCDALLLLGTEDGRALDADLVTVGRQDRQSARARSNRLLPCGVLNRVGARIATEVRKTTARNLQADWLDATDPTWVATVTQWLKNKSALAESG